MIKASKSLHIHFWQTTNLLYPKEKKERNLSENTKVKSKIEITTQETRLFMYICVENCSAAFIVILVCLPQIIINHSHPIAVQWGKYWNISAGIYVFLLCSTPIRSFCTTLTFSVNKWQSVASIRQHSHAYIDTYN